MTIHSYIINKKTLFNYKECYLCSIESSNREVIGSNPSGLLLYLIKNQGNTVTIDEISNYFMVKGRVVNSTTAIQYISKLRKTFKSLEENTSIIETIKGGGYYIPSYIDIIEYNEGDNAYINTERDMLEASFEDENEYDNAGDIHQRFAQSKKYKNICYVLLTLVLIFSFLFIIDIFNGNVFTHYEKVNYRMEKVINGCSVYIDHDYPDKGSKVEVVLMKDINIFCNKNKFAYLTYFEYSSNYSIIFCKEPIYKNKKRDICSSLSRLGND
ncbi:winged helix family transcriptional regulator [Klebsiella aerogenes]|uniref:winged helix-turn-helix domain-containing protein n=1 Tax=Klebsiella aerogenes TaxID=548 RepID=UPI000F7DA96B|nr:helix-turn-helix domain-containing protein [Klebsiella aerogenes]RSV78981.1 winged helix family transcriptional regulator [Klebsiella aerogenes]HBY9712684.1 winged helix-turn-helix domain-containing protein [Klebsiella aerogenes]